MRSWIRKRTRKIRKQFSRPTRKKLEEKINSMRVSERRLYEATQVRKDWVTSSAPNQRSHWQAKPLRDQARHLYENDPIARRCVDSIVCNMIGKGVMPIVQTENAAQGANEQVESIVTSYLNRWLSTTEGDFDGDNTLIGLQSLVVKALVKDGAVFVRRVVKRKKLRLQILEHDYLDVTYTTGKDQKNGREVVNGIEFDRWGRISAYYLWEYHPEDNIGAYGGRNTNVSVPNPHTISAGIRGVGGRSLRIPVSEICHIKRIDRPGQHDGVTWLAPALIKFWDLREYEEAKLKQQKIQACFTALIKDNFALSEEEREDTLGLSVNKLESNLDEPSLRSVEPGLVEELPPGKDVVFPSPTGTTDERFIERGLRQIAGALGVSYEIFNDYSQVNYSSGRMGFLEMDRNLKHALKTVVEPQFLLKIGEWVITHLEMHGAIPQNSGVFIKWAPPAREMIDPQAESQAIANMVATNLISMREAHAMLGYDFEQKIQDIVQSNQVMAEAGLQPLLTSAGSVTNIEEEVGNGEAPAP